MGEEYLRDRIAALREQKDVSEYRMSLDLGHSKSYIQSISSGKSLPSMAEFFGICEYLGVSPKDFFDDRQQYPALANQLFELTLKMEKEDLEMIVSFAKRLVALRDEVSQK